MKIFAFLLQSLPSILSAIMGVEAAVKAPGATKKAIVLGAIQAAAQAGEGIPNGATQAISSVIDHAVTELNNSGVFTKSVPMAAPVAAS